ncbi:MAG: hypothetical protein HDR39_00460 [Treponema sp.]|nr:hypothetical protein [Treponema sp.]
MNVENNIKIPLRTVKIPLSDEEESAFNSMLQRTWQKKGGFLRLIILRELEKQNLLPQGEQK